MANDVVARVWVTCIVCAANGARLAAVAEYYMDSSVLSVVSVC